MENKFSPYQGGRSTKFSHHLNMVLDSNLFKANLPFNLKKNVKVKVIKY